MTKKEKEGIVTLHFVPLTMTKKKEGDPETSACLQQEKDCRMTKK
jgi:hypothetical protein